MIDIGEKNVIKTIDIANEPIAVAFGPGHSAFVISTSSRTVEVINTTDHTQIRSLALGATPTALLVSPDGSTVYVKKNDNSLSLIDTATLNVINTPGLTTGRTGGIAISADGTRLYLGDTAAVNVYALN